MTLRRRALVAVVLTAATLGGPVLAVGVDAAAAAPRVPAQSPAPTPSGTASPALRLPIRATLSRLDPKAPQPGQRIAVVGRLTNTGSSTIRDLTVQLRINRFPLTSRDQIEAFANGGDESFPSRLVRRAEGRVGAVSLAPGAATSFRLDVPGDALSLGTDEWQVFEIGVDVLGTGDEGTTTVGRMRTFLPWAPVSVRRAAVRLAWLWPLVDRPHRAGSDAWQDDDLAKLLADHGALTGLTAAAAGAATAPAPRTPVRGRPVVSAKSVPVAWVVDPMLVEDATAMSKGYRVTDGGTTRAGTGAAAAQAWLAGLDRAVRGADLYDLPYADPDLTATTHHGLSADTAAAAKIGSGLQGATPLIWPPDGLLDDITLETLSADDRRRALVLADTALPLTESINYTPTAEVTVVAGGRTVDALLTDSRLGATVDDGAADPARAGLAEQRFLAETLMIVAELPFTRRDIVVAPDRRWRPSPGYAAALLSDSGRVPWIDPVPLGSLLSETRSTVERAPLSYPDSARAQELPGGYLADVRSLRSSLTSFASALPRDAVVVTDLDRAVLRTQSSGWRDDPARAEANRADVATTLSDDMAKVRIASARGSLVTLTSRSGRVPVTIANDLKSPAKVRVRLDAGQRLTIAGGGDVPLTVPAGTQYTIEVRARARTAGVFPLTVTLVAPDGTPMGAPVTLSVRSTVYGTVALGITGAATAVLFLAVVVRLVRRAVRTRHGGAA